MELLQELAGDSNETILQLVLKEDELSWQQIIHDLVRKEQMDPWNINLHTLTQNFLKVIRKLQEHDFRVSGKIVLASALLLKIKSDRLMDEDMSLLDSLIQSTEEEDEPIDLLGMDYEEYFGTNTTHQERPRIYPRTPQPRQRKVSVYDLVTALEQALEVNIRRERRALDTVEISTVHAPTNVWHVDEMMNVLLNKISNHFKQAQELLFSHLIPSENKLDKVLTFIPLLHLTNERRIDLKQPTHFGEIFIHLLDDTPVIYEPEAIQA